MHIIVIDMQSINWLIKIASFFRLSKCKAPTMFELFKKKTKFELIKWVLGVILFSAGATSGYSPVRTNYSEEPQNMINAWIQEPKVASLDFGKNTIIITSRIIIEDPPTWRRHKHERLFSLITFQDPTGKFLKERRLAWPATPVHLERIILDHELLKNDAKNEQIYTRQAGGNLMNGRS